jgi:hypothetical protein
MVTPHPRRNRNFAWKVARVIPLPGIFLAVYNLMLVGGDISQRLEGVLLDVTLLSGAPWVFRVGHLLLALSLLGLYFEMLKATRTSTGSVPDHVLSMLVAGIYLVEFITVRGCGTSIFMLLGLIAVIDVMAGFTISIVAARRDLAFTGAGD